jgi:hypothetical protein
MSNEKSQGKSASSPGHTKPRTIVKADGTSLVLSLAEIKSRRDELMAEGYTGPGLDLEDTESEAPEGSTESGSGS